MPIDLVGDSLMARIAYPDPASQSHDVLDRLQRTGSLNVNRMMSHAEGPMLAYSRLGVQLLLRGKLDPILREVAVLRVGQLCGSAYEWHQHVGVARAVGMDEATLQAVSEKTFDRLTDVQQVAVTIAEEVKRDSGARADTIARARAHLTSEQLVELLLVVGYYIMTAGVLLSLDIEVEDGPTLGETMSASS